MESYRKLDETYDVIVIEGAGSPAEINLKKDDIVNMGLAKMVDAPVLLVGDIDRGGVFAQLLGTLMLLTDAERERVKGLIINKFRGDKTILDPGIIMLEERGRIPVCGVLPYMKLSLDDEDSLTTRFTRKGNGAVTIAVVRLPRISNISDFTVFEQIDDVNLIYVNQPKELEQADMVILPGSKNTIGDLKWLRESGMEAAIKRFAIDNPVFGICGGYQMLGMQIDDPEQTEEGGSIRGMELLPIRTVLKLQKQTRQVTGTFDKVAGTFSCLSGQSIRGYEIHMGETILDEHASGLITLENDSDTLQQGHPDGSQKENVYGCYVHGIFDSPEMSGGFLSALLKEKGYDPETVQAVDWKSYKEEQYDKLADIVRASLDMKEIYRIIGL